jgi:hypothetical protein
MKWIIILFLDFSTLYYEMKILVIWNNSEYNALMNCKIRCVYNRGKKCECVHILMQICYSNNVE